MLLATDEKRRTVFHLTAKAGIPDIRVLQEKLNWAKKKLISQEMNELLLAIDHERMIAWHGVARCLKP